MPHGGGRIAHPRARPANADDITDDREPAEAVANIKSQIKRNLQNERRRLRNNAVRSELRTRRKNALAEATSEGGATDALRLAIKRIDMAAAKGVIHKNKAARDKSRLMKAVARSSEISG